LKTYVTDANVLFSCLLSGNEKYKRVFKECRLYLPDFALSEIQEHQSEILAKTKIPASDLRSYTLAIFDALIVVPNFLISNQSYLSAFRLCKDIDEDDTAYLALSIEFDITLLSNDRILVEGLRRKGFTNVITLTELFDIL
jgi:predicted nucleic acid-binding protein